MNSVVWILVCVVDYVCPGGLNVVMAVCLSVCLFWGLLAIYLVFYLPLHLSLYLSIYLSISIQLSTYPLLLIYLSTCIYVSSSYLLPCLSLYHSIYVSIYFYVHLSIFHLCLFGYLSIYLPLNLNLFVSISTSFYPFVLVIRLPRVDQKGEAEREERKQGGGRETRGGREQGRKAMFKREYK